MEQNPPRPAEVVDGDGLRGSERYFVKIRVGPSRNVRRLAGMSLDLHAQSGKEGASVVDGLLTLDEIARVVHAGFPVTVEADADSRAHGRNVIDFESWLASQEQDLGSLGEVT